MVCIAAFIILCLLSVFVGILSIFRRDLGAKYWKTFKKSWGCVGKRVTFQKCETNFKTDIKNSILKKVVIKRPKLVKPISVGIEIVAILIVAITVWSLATAVKSGLSLWTFGTCDVVRPSACAIGAEICSIDQEAPKNPIEAVGRWFADWGEIFSAIPDKFRTWDSVEFNLTGFRPNEIDFDKPFAADILDPGCTVCLQSFKNQLSSGFFDSHNVLIIPFPIENPDGTYKFKNSGLISRYLLAVAQFSTPVQLEPSENRNAPSTPALRILQKIFTEYNEDHIIYQNVFNERLENDEAELLLQTWLADLGYSDFEILTIQTLARSDQISDQLTKNQNIVEHQIRVKGIPTTIFDGRRHTGLFKSE